MQNRKTLQHTVTPEQSGQVLAAIVREMAQSPWSRARTLVWKSHVMVNHATANDPAARLQEGDIIELDLHAPIVPASSRNPVAIEFVHVDPHLVVVFKPPGINTVPYESGEKDTLVDRVQHLLHKQHGAPPHAPLFVVHRIDRTTSGLVVFGRTWLAKRHFAGLFRAHTISRTYLALVNGYVTQQQFTIRSNLVEDRGDGLRGSSRSPKHGVPAVTHVQVIAHAKADATLIACRLETGRTHQIRIHLSEHGHPLVGEQVYIRRYQGTRIEAPRTMLHAFELGFTHPSEIEQVMHFQQEPPTDFRDACQMLGLPDLTWKKAIWRD